MSIYPSYGRYKPYGRYQHPYSGMGAPNIAPQQSAPYKPSFTTYLGLTGPGQQNAGAIASQFRSQYPAYQGGGGGSGGSGGGGGGGGDGGGLPDFSNLDYSNDPILLKVRALNKQLIAQAEAGALANKKQALIDFGANSDLVTKYLGQGDSATATAAQQNPFSLLAQLLTAHNKNTLGIDEGRNKQNLFYSSTRGQDLTDEQKAYLQSQAQGQSDLDKQLTGFQQAVVDARNYASQQELQANEDAYGRAIQRALALASLYQGQGGGGGDGGGGSVDPSSPGYGGVVPTQNFLNEAIRRSQSGSDYNARVRRYLYGSGRGPQ